MKIIILNLLCLLALTVSAHAQRYLVNLSDAVQTVSGAFGTGDLRFTKADFLRGVAETHQPALDPAGLTLVFDVNTNQFLVVDRATGTLVTVVYTLSNNREYNFGPGDVLGSPSQLIRRADLLEANGITPVGSVAGFLQRGLGESVQDFYRSYYRWTADFQTLSDTGGAFVTYNEFSGKNQHQPMLLRGKFKVRNHPFVPSTSAE